MKNYHFFSDERILSIGQSILLKDGEAHHIINVKRLGRGDAITIIDGEGVMADVVIEDVSGNSVKVEVNDIKESMDDRYDIVVIVSLLKGEAMDWLVQKLTELGVKEIRPVITDFSVVRLDNTKKRQKIKRLKEISRQALKQCRSFMAPEICDIMPIEEALASIDKGGSKIWLWELKEGQRDLFTVFEAFNFSLPIYVLIGSEGGFSRREIEMIPTYGFVAASLGRRILRAETAAISAVSSIISSINQRLGYKANERI